jgi:protein required for attachment to host cells
MLRIVVADEREASFFDVVGPQAPLTLASKIENPTARLHDRDLESDRPGRSFNRAAGQRSAVDGDRSSRRSQQEDFARRIAEEIDRERNAETFDRLVLMAGPRMLGLIREALSAPARSLVSAEVPKDLVHSAERAIRDHLPRAAFQ